MSTWSPKDDASTASDWNSTPTVWSPTITQPAPPSGQKKQREILQEARINLLKKLPPFHPFRHRIYDDTGRLVAIQPENRRRKRPRREPKSKEQTEDPCALLEYYQFTKIRDRHCDNTEDLLTWLKVKPKVERLMSITHGIEEEYTGTDCAEVARMVMQDEQEDEALQGQSLLLDGGAGNKGHAKEIIEEMDRDILDEIIAH